MSQFTLHTKATLLIAISLAVGACSKQEETPPATPANAASAPVSPNAMTAADCDKLPDPARSDDSAAGRAAAVSQGQALRRSCKKTVEQAQETKPNADLARIREIKEKEQSDQSAREKSNKEWFGNLSKGAKQPVKEYKY